MGVAAVLGFSAAALVSEMHLLAARYSGGGGPAPTWTTYQVKNAEMTFEPAREEVVRKN